MTNFFPSIYLSIRQKVVVGFILSMIAVLLIGFVTYRNLLRIDLKLRFVISAYSLHDSLLEVRRYEKNFLLYGLSEDQQAAFAYLNLGKKTSAKVEIDVKGLEGAVLDALKAAGIDLAPMTFSAEFGRRLDYYTGFVFEIHDSKRPGAGQIIGGGRYDRLLDLLGADGSVPAVGFSIWLDRI